MVELCKKLMKNWKDYATDSETNKPVGGEGIFDGMPSSSKTKSSNRRPLSMLVIFLIVADLLFFISSICFLVGAYTLSMSLFFLSYYGCKIMGALTVLLAFFILINVGHKKDKVSRSYRILSAYILSSTILCALSLFLRLWLTNVDQNWELPIAIVRIIALVLAIVLNIAGFIHSGMVKRMVE